MVFQLSYFAGLWGALNNVLSDKFDRFKVSNRIDVAHCRWQASTTVIVFGAIVVKNDAIIKSMSGRNGNNSCRVNNDRVSVLWAADAGLLEGG